MKSSTAYPWCLRGVRSTSNERTRSVGIVGDGEGVLWCIRGVGEGGSVLYYWAGGGIVLCDGTWTALGSRVWR